MLLNLEKANPRDTLQASLIAIINQKQSLGKGSIKRYIETELIIKSQLSSECFATQFQFLIFEDTIDQWK